MARPPPPGAPGGGVFFFGPPPAGHNRIKWHTGKLENHLRGPASLDDGTQNLAGRLRTSMGTFWAPAPCGEMQSVEVVWPIPAHRRGKCYQKASQLGQWAT